MRGVLKGLPAGVALLLAGPAQARPADALPAMQVESTVLVMRHGVRPPTKMPAMPAAITPEHWPDWPVAPGWLTPHGGLAIERLGAADGAALRVQGLLPPRGCPATGAVRVVADSDQRTIATADHWLKALVPGCTIAADHLAQGAPDPRFGPLESGFAHLDATGAQRAVEQAIGPGGLAGLEDAQRPLLARLDAILCGAREAPCGVAREPAALVPGKAGGRLKLAGSLDRASTAAQILLLEYAEGKPLAEVGWGRASAADIAALSAFHALEFRLLARPLPIASANLAGLVPVIREGLQAPGRLTMISGHDTNVANLGGLLGLHWQVPGFAPDDPAPGGAIVLERLRAGDGTAYVRAFYRAQRLEDIRAARGHPLRLPLRMEACAPPGGEGLCRWDDFVHALGR